MVGISEIASGDTETGRVQPALPCVKVIMFEDLCEEDQMMMAFWEIEEPAMSPVYIDPYAAKTVRPNPEK